VTTMFRRPTSGRNRCGNESQVLRPITTGWPIVTALKCAMSSGSCHGIVPSRPITPARVCAQIKPTSDGNWCLDGGVMLVADDRNVLEGVIEQRRRLAKLELRELVWIAAQLFVHLVGVVVVDVAIAA